MMRTARVIAIAGLATLGGSCGEDSNTTDGGMIGSCKEETRDDTYAPGMEKAGTGGLFKVRLMEADPAPPAKRDNKWNVQVVDAAGTPVDGAKVTVVPFMPDHNHASAKVTVVTPVGTDGMYTLEPVYLFMSGLWEVTINVEMDAQTKDKVLYYFCIP